jgi:hypothetical protein
VVVSKDSLDWNSLNAQISQNPGQDYGSRLNAALGNKLIQNVPFEATAKGTMHFKVDGKNNRVVACIVAIDKQ